MKRWIITAIFLAVSSPASAQLRPGETIMACIAAEQEAPRGVFVMCEGDLYAGFLVKVSGQWGGRLICRRIDTARCVPDILTTLTKPDGVALAKGDRISCRRTLHVATCSVATFRQ